MGTFMRFEVNDYVKKTSGDYTFKGWVAAIVTKKSGVQRYVVETIHGMLLVVNDGQLESWDGRYE